MSVLSCIDPPINTANIQSSYNYNVQSSFSSFQVLSGIVSSSTTECTYSYALYYSDGTLYSGTSPLSLGSSTGILTITSNIEFSYTLKIIVSTVELSTPFTSTTSSFTVSVTKNCANPSIISATIKSSYTYNLQSSFSAFQVLSSYVSSTTSVCTYSYAAYFSDGTLYSAASPLSLESSTGILTITSNIKFSYTIYIVVSTV